MVLGRRILRGVNQPSATPPPENPNPFPGTSRLGPIIRLAEVDSTNRYLLDAARAGEASGTVVVADHQSAGRGRLGRTWEAPAGASLLMSVLLRPEIAPEITIASVHLLTMAAGLAMADAVEAVAGFAPILKWPNDLLVGDRKLCGMLTESEISDGSLRCVVVGIGVNVQWSDFPAELVETATACNLVSGRDISRDELLNEFLDRYSVLLNDLNSVLSDYRERLGTLNTRVRIELAGEAFEGIAEGVTDDGSLEVRTDGGALRCITAGDVVHLRPV
ncbi:MAG: biotin--[acetyl-CoA-carboxylase] ligase [Actinobacteria bacterium]|nr:biotin--[acetyl-CoA-carboxylase] ligase [Actinomycetota bacterium]